MSQQNPPPDSSVGGGSESETSPLEALLEAVARVRPISNSSLAWNALAGVAIEVAPGMEATLNYRYMRSTEKEKFGVRLAGIPGSDDRIEVRPESHAFTVGIRYYFTLGVSLR